MKQLLEKIEENRKFIDAERAKRTFDLFNLKDIEAWENKIKTSVTPINKFYESWIKVHEAQKLKLLTQNDEHAADMHVPPIKKKSKRGKPRQSDSEDDSDLDIPVEEMERRLKKSAAKKAKKVQKKTKNVVDKEDKDYGMDVVQDIKDWE